ncbi:conserved protein of unknown function [Magnetospirillum sp. XM-1]|uniref:transglutaminase-like domain-containing protein n=1 Tax=Magnetospirillum sp. XM-1 TaxID=1663591 RepID=UPI00073DE14D|nr:transglutaminase-like domain-containing protein [Magnetospirillum sp. XM-1]CUW41742.1 conserved protein of unknown function [Magnetospirillum sp. XM-1]
MNRLLLVLAMVLTAFAGSNAWAQASAYDSAVQSWKSYREVADWLNTYYTFDHSRLSQMLKQRGQGGAAALRTREPAKTFEIRSGYCTDAAGFAITSLNRINPDYKAGYVFIRNGSGSTHHWVAGFHVDGKIYVMDYGPSSEWKQMRGVHGPYDSLDEYQTFLSALSLRNFSPAEVSWKNFPGEID